MKVCIIQPAYSVDFNLTEDYFKAELDLLSRCDDSMDIIVMPESCDVPCLAGSKENADKASQKYKDAILSAASETAKRCNAIVFINARSQEPTGARNTTYAINREGEVVGKYFKQHLTPGEVSKTKLDSDYTYEFSETTVIEIDGLRFAFLVCYDCYFYESFPNIARENVDFVIACSHQRSDTHSALEIMTRFLAYHTNAYVLRSSVSMDEKSDIGGASMIVAPNGDVLANMYSRVGMVTAEIDPTAKYYKPAGFGNPPAAHYEYIEEGRRPWKYRPAGSAIVRHDAVMPYPRVCAHRGFNTIAPENSLAAFGAAVAMGAEEIEFDLWFTKDGEVVSIHDPTLDRVSNGTGKVWEHTLAELRELDFGSKRGEQFAGIKIPTFEEILKKFACHAVMNIHLKPTELTTEQMDKILGLIHKYDCEKYVYFMSGKDRVLEFLMNEYPSVTRCCGGGDGKWEIVDRAIKYGCKKVQLVSGYFNREMIEAAHGHGIVCNVFEADTPELTREYLDMGIDTILTNDYNNIARAVREYTKEKRETNGS